MVCLVSTIVHEFLTLLLGADIFAVDAIVHQPVSVSLFGSEDAKYGLLFTLVTVCLATIDSVVHQLLWLSLLASDIFSVDAVVHQSAEKVSGS